MKFAKLVLMMMVLGGCAGEHTPYESAKSPNPGGLSGEVKFDAVLNQVLATNCTGCHRPGAGIMDLTTYAAVMGRSGLVVPGSPRTSRLYTVINQGVMPPLGALAPELQAVVFKWIEQGAME